jgi:hypothetical protein
MRPPRLRCIRNIVGASLFAVAIAAPVSALVTIEFGRPQVPGFSNNYPWFNDVPQYPGNQSFQYFLAYHPNIALALSRNPGLLYNASWRSQYPELEQYLANHPYAWQALNNADWSTGPGETRWGGYNDQHQWRDAYWWHQNNPNWFYDNHQDWASLDSRWLAQDGAYDQQRQWHYGEWWYNQNPSWVTTNHPNWLAEHRNWENQNEQQSYRQGHTMPAQRQQDNLPRHGIDQPQRSKEIRQAALDQRQLNVQRQPDHQRQQRLNHDQNQHQQQASREQLQATKRQNQQAVHQRDQQQQAMHQENQRQQQLSHQENQHRQQANRQQLQVASRQNQAAVHQQQKAARQSHHQRQVTHAQQNTHEQKHAQ